MRALESFPDHVGWIDTVGYPGGMTKDLAEDVVGKKLNVNNCLLVKLFGRHDKGTRSRCILKGTDSNRDAQLRIN